VNNRGLFALCAAARSTPLRGIQREVVIGSLLGDATLLRTTAGYCFRVHHGIAQRALVDWKYGYLRNLVRSAPRVSGAGYYFRTVTHPDLAPLRAAFYAGSVKVVPEDLLRDYCTPLALAVWIMDDGASDGNQLRINTQCFTWEECESLGQLLLRKFRIQTSINLDKGKPHLRCASKSMPRLRELVEPHMLPEMLYKLPR
jgi:LAGLIDADG DNA endonuclease family protein